MSDKSAIEWTDATWNPTTGCTKVSEGCRHCYIDRTPPFRIKGIRFLKGDEPSNEIGSSTGVLLHPDRLDQPLRWKRPRRVFVNSLSDLFHDDIPDQFIGDAFEVMRSAHWHTFQVLTKRPRRMASVVREFIEGNGISPPPNVWLGTSVEDQKAADLRIPLLLETPAAVRFLSCEPLLGPVELSGAYFDYLGHNGGPAWTVEPTHDPHCDGSCSEGRCPVAEQVQTPRVDWVIVGGESGPSARPMHPAWARSLRDQSVDAGVPFFFKQWGAWIECPEEEDESEHRRHGGRFLNNTDGTDRDLFTGGVFMRNVGKKSAGRELDGRTWDEMPEAVTV